MLLASWLMLVLSFVLVLALEDIFTMLVALEDVDMEDEEEQGVSATEEQGSEASYPKPQLTQDLHSFGWLNLLSLTPPLRTSRLFSLTILGI